MIDRPFVLEGEMTVFMKPDSHSCCSSFFFISACIICRGRLGSALYCTLKNTESRTDWHTSLKEVLYLWHSWFGGIVGWHSMLCFTGTPAFIYLNQICTVDGSRLACRKLSMFSIIFVWSFWLWSKLIPAGLLVCSPESSYKCILIKC